MTTGPVGRVSTLDLAAVRRLWFLRLCRFLFDKHFLRLKLGGLEKRLTRLFGLAPRVRFHFRPRQLPRQFIVRVHSSTVGALSIDHRVNLLEL